MPATCRSSRAGASAINSGRAPSGSRTPPRSTSARPTCAAAWSSMCGWPPTSSPARRHDSEDPGQRARCHRHGRPEVRPPAGGAPLVRSRGRGRLVRQRGQALSRGRPLALAPLHRAYGLEKLFVSTVQAVSGAGYPGVPSLDILGNVVPYIGGEEEKMERESRKILGTLAADGVTPADFAMSAHTNRVATIDGHLMTVSAGFRTRGTPESATTPLRGVRAGPRGA